MTATDQPTTSLHDATFAYGNVLVTIDEAGFTADDRPSYSVKITVDGLRTFRDETLAGGCGAELDAVAMLPTLGSFLGAWAEAQDYEGSENADLFPAEMFPLADWSEIADQLAMLEPDDEEAFVSDHWEITDLEADEVAADLDDYEHYRHHEVCEVCGPIGGSDWLSKANSDASWHNTGTGHVVTVLSTDEG